MQPARMCASTPRPEKKGIGGQGLRGVGVLGDHPVTRASAKIAITVGLGGQPVVFRCVSKRHVHPGLEAARNVVVQYHDGGWPMVDACVADEPMEAPRLRLLRAAGSGKRRSGGKQCREPRYVLQPVGATAGLAQSCIADGGHHAFPGSSDPTRRFAGCLSAAMGVECLRRRGNEPRWCRVFLLMVLASRGHTMAQPMDSFGRTTCFCFRLAPGRLEEAW
jgi:hypothetical protein